MLEEIPQLAAGTPESLALGVLLAAARGFKVYLTASAFSKLSDILLKLGVRVREVKGEITDDSYILINVEKYRVIITIKDGDHTETRTLTLSAFTSALNRIAKRKGSQPKGAQGAPKVYSVEVPPDLEEVLASIAGGEE